MNGDSGKAEIQTDCLTGGTPSTSAARFQPILFQIGVISMRGTRIEIRLRVIVGTLVFVLDEQRYGCPQGHAMLQARLEVDEVLFRSLENTC